MKLLKMALQHLSLQDDVIPKQPQMPDRLCHAQVLQYAGIKKHSSKLSSHQRTKSGRMFGDYTPKFTQGGVVLPAPCHGTCPYHTILKACGASEFFHQAAAGQI